MGNFGILRLVLTSQLKMDFVDPVDILFSPSVHSFFKTVSKATAPAYNRFRSLKALVSGLCIIVDENLLTYTLDVSSAHYRYLTSLIPYATTNIKEKVEDIRSFVNLDDFEFSTTSLLHNCLFLDNQLPRFEVSSVRLFVEERSVAIVKKVTPMARALLSPQRSSSTGELKDLDLNIDPSIRRSPRTSGLPELPRPDKSLISLPRRHSINNPSQGHSPHTDRENKSPFSSPRFQTSAL